MKRIAVFGATGKTGMPLIKEALERGHKVKVLVRTPEKLGKFQNQVEVIQGDVADAFKVEETVRGVDIVLVVIGHGKNSPEDLQSKAITNIITAMKANNVSRVVSLTGSGVPDKSNDKPKLIHKVFDVVISLAIKKAFLDGKKHAEILSSSDLNWTVVRAPVLTQAKGKGTYKTGFVGKNGMALSIPREDLSKAILDISEDAKFYKSMPFVTG